MIAATVTGRARRCALMAGGMVGALALAGALTGDAGPARGTRGDPGAVGLLRAAADAARRVPYEGRRFLTTWNRTRSATSEVGVAHRPGEGARYVSAAGTEGYRPDSAAGETAGFTAGTLSLLTRNYSVVRAADASVCGRRARVVEARRADGSTAGRFWLDSETGLMLRRELVDATGRRVVASGFTEIDLGVPSGGRFLLRAAPPARGADRADPDMTNAPAAALTPWEERLDRSQLAALREDGWPVPKSLPGRLTLYEARRDNGTVHLSYSDGLAAVSVFVQRGSLDETRLAGWQKSARRGRTVFRREALRRWAVSAENGYVYTVLTDVPQSTAEAVALNLPRGGTPFWTRVARGARRLGSVVNPFG
ncbi:MucB/RseB C-terminal domain-containing protein [Actinomadura macra]|uniref:MucB/RseB C-terminal domain-containing protein n=1 Tax=Actinomadura macra TaxID=46164 RepID=UPI000AD5BF41|nr:MucB/RseB C-terminal domain-containing protein [Actinomadura macra]